MSSKSKTTKQSSGKKKIKAIAAPKKKKRVKGHSHYHTGTHNSLKSITPVTYRSGWELEVAKFLDADVNVSAYAYEAVAIPYISNVRSGRIRKYFPDFFVKYKDGRKVIIEVKRSTHLENIIVLKKAEAAKKWCSDNGYHYEFWTDKDIQRIKKFNESFNKSKAK